MGLKSSIRLHDSEARQGMLHDRLVGSGTLDQPKGHSNPLFALPATVNWMRALRILVENERLDFSKAEASFAQVKQRQVRNSREHFELMQNTVLMQLFLALHNLSALEQFPTGKRVSDHARVGIIAWYYGIADAACAMTVAQGGSFSKTHRGTADSWDKHMASKDLVMYPFNWRVGSLVKQSYEAEIENYRDGSSGILQETPNSKIKAIGAAAQYLKGCADWYAEIEKEKIKKDKAFKDLEVDDFRTKNARELRDRWLRNRSIGFVHQAYRYRGKANYREALFLAYGSKTNAFMTTFIDDLAIVLRGFLTMAGAFAKRKLGDSIWTEFVSDVDANGAFSIKASCIWS